MGYKAPINCILTCGQKVLAGCQLESQQPLGGAAGKSRYCGKVIEKGKKEKEKEKATRVSLRSFLSPFHVVHYALADNPCDFGDLRVSFHSIHGQWTSESLRWPSIPDVALSLWYKIHKLLQNWRKLLVF